ncbi:phospholipid-translocating p-type flippase subfamily protein, partial [Cystoisospora suis]
MTEDNSSIEGEDEDDEWGNEPCETGGGKCECCGCDMGMIQEDPFSVSSSSSCSSSAFPQIEASAPGVSLHSFKSQSETGYPSDVRTSDGAYIPPPHERATRTSPVAFSVPPSHLPGSIPSSPSLAGAGASSRTVQRVPLDSPSSRSEEQSSISVSMSTSSDQHCTATANLPSLSRPQSAQHLFSRNPQGLERSFSITLRSASRLESTKSISRERWSLYTAEAVLSRSHSLNGNQEDCQMTRARDAAYISVVAHTASNQDISEPGRQTADADLSSVPVAPSPAPSVTSPSHPSQRSGSCTPAATAGTAARVSVAPGDGRPSSSPSHLHHRPHNHGGLVAVQLAALRLTPEAEYDASSPDELALTAAAKHMGAEFICRPSLSTIQLALTTSYAEDCLLSAADKAHLSRLRQSIKTEQEHEARRAEERESESNKDDEVTARAKNGERFSGIKEKEEDETPGTYVPVVVFDVLEVLEFDNFRKRMSVVIRDRDGRLRLLVKGADSSVLDIAARGQDKLKRDLTDQLAEMASQGLRTLVMGQRYLTEKQFQKYRAMLLAAKGETGDRKEEALNAVLARIEKNIELLGASGIDDKLQDQVAETISDIKQAGVKLWVLTGDKMETAIAIGHSCSILSDATYNAIVDGTSQEAVREQLHQYMSYIVAAQLASEAFEQIALR